MTRKLLFSNGSPFATRVRIVLAEKGLAYEKDVLDALRPVENIRPKEESLSPEDQRLDREYRRELALELGHDRHDIVGQYVGA